MLRFVYLGTKEVHPGLYVCIGFYESDDFWNPIFVRKSDSVEDWDRYIWQKFLNEEV